MTRDDVVTQAGDIVPVTDAHLVTQAAGVINNPGKGDATTETHASDSVTQAPGSEQAMDW